jgi:hypothetical protein
MLRPSFETLAEFIIGPRFARTRWQAPQDEFVLSVILTCEPTGRANARPMTDFVSLEG